MKLNDLCEVFETRFPAAGVSAHPERDSVLVARAVISSAVVDDEFLAECIALELNRLEDNRLRRGLVPFFKVPNLGILFAFGYWPPGGTPGPHEHTAWTITAVCRNELEVLTYNRDESYRRRKLIPKNRFQAPAGRVGFIYEPCIHEPINTSDEWSLSLHVTSPRDGERLTDYEECLPDLAVVSELTAAEATHPYANVMVAHYRRKFVHQLVRILSSMEVRQTTCLLEQCGRLASSATRRVIDGINSSNNAHESSWLLARTHKDLALSYHYIKDSVALDVETANGRVEELRISKEACDTIAFIVTEPIFDVHALPGNLTAEERMMIGDVLEETGLFTRVQSWK